jgi:hypothetical protein
VYDVNSNGRGDIVDIMTTARDPRCYYYLPLVVSYWRQPWPTATPTATPTRTPTATPTASPTAATPTATSTPGADNPNPPTSPVKLIFIHHSTGGNWLADPAGNDLGGDLGHVLMDNN